MRKSLSVIRPVVLFATIFLLNNQPVMSQYDNNWLITGYSFNSLIYSDTNGAFIKDTSSLPPIAGANSATISDKNGILLFYTNGCNVYNRNLAPISGNNLIYSNSWTNMNCPYVADGLCSIFLSPTGDDSVYYYLYLPSSDAYGPAAPQELFLYTIDLRADSGLGAIVQSERVDTGYFGYGFFSACKHANGRDWWILLRDRFINNYRTYLLTPNGIVLSQVQSIGPTGSNQGLGDGRFSPDGSHYVTNSHNYNMHIYDFDRCTGMLSNFRQDVFADTANYSIAFSKSGHFLYLFRIKDILQYDMQSGNIPATRTLIATFDGYTDSICPGSAGFLFGRRAANGKIYVYCRSCSYLTVIDNPENAGVACNVMIRSDTLPSFGNDYMMYAEYNLGAVQGSVCDTITSVKENVLYSHGVKVYPNPANNKIVVDSKELLSEYILYNFEGRKVQQGILAKDKSIEVKALDNGLYLLVLKSDEKQFNEKIIISH